MTATITPEKLIKGLELLQIAIFAEPIYREPGTGAIEFAKQYTEGKSWEEAKEIISKLLAGELHDKSDKRIKRCDYCGYYWRDTSRNNTKKTCSEECKRKIKTLQRRKQRERQALMNPKRGSKKRKLEDDYHYWHEYSYWIDENSMFKFYYKHEKLVGNNKLIDFIEAKNDILGKGNRRVTYDNTEYDGD